MNAVQHALCVCCRQCCAWAAWRFGCRRPTLCSPRILSADPPQPPHLHPKLQWWSCCPCCCSSSRRPPRCCSRLQRVCRPDWQLPRPPQRARQLRLTLEAGSAMCLSCVARWRTHQHAAAAGVHGGRGQRRRMQREQQAGAISLWQHSPSCAPVDHDFSAPACLHLSS